MTTRDSSLLALCLWREARGQSNAARLAILHVVLNRCAEHGQVPAQVILANHQFSSFNATDPNVSKFPSPTDPIWIQCCADVDNPGEDPTGGAQNYESCDPHKLPAWADLTKMTTMIAPFRFYKL